MRPCFNPVQHQRELMAAYERDRDSAASVSEPCADCRQPMTEICEFCSGGFCERHMETHQCTVRILRRGL